MIPIVLVALAVLLSIGLWAMNYLGLKAVAEQQRYHAVTCVCELVAGSIERGGGKQWPRSWEELESLPPRDFNSFAWPRDEELLKGLVTIDFSATVESALSQSPETFGAIRPAGGTGVFPLAPIYENFLLRIGRAAGR